MIWSMLWCYFSVIKWNLCVNWRQLMKYESIITHRSQIDSLQRGCEQVKVNRSAQWHIVRPARLWPVFFGMRINRVVIIYSEFCFFNSFAPTVGIRSYAQKKEVHQILAKSVNIYPPNMDIEIFHGIYIEEITQKRKICITVSIFIQFILFPSKKMCMVCLKYIHSQKLKILENQKTTVT